LGFEIAAFTKARIFKDINLSKREYFYGIKVVIASRDGYPLRVIFCPGKEHDSF
jgi:hypothetical protein